MNETISTILGVGGVGGIVFGVYNYFRNPQINSEKTNALFGQRLDEIQKEISTFTTGFQAHLQSDLTSFSNLNTHIVEVDKSVVRLTTIIEERIPRKTKK
jgi:hypothetical protein